MKNIIKKEFTKKKMVSSLTKNNFERLNESQLKTITGGDLYIHPIPGSNNRP